MSHHVQKSCMYFFMGRICSLSDLSSKVSEDKNCVNIHHNLIESIRPLYWTCPVTHWQKVPFKVQMSKRHEKIISAIPCRMLSSMISAAGVGETSVEILFPVLGVSGPLHALEYQQLSIVHFNRTRSSDCSCHGYIAGRSGVMNLVFYQPLRV